MTDFKSLIEKEISIIKNIPLEKIPLMVDFLCLPKRIATSGMGKAGQIAHTLATTLSSTGTPSYFVHPAEAQHGDLGMIGENDVVVVISNSGKTREVIEFIHLCRQLNPYIRIYGIIGKPDSEIESLCNHSIIYGEVEEICPLGLTPTTSTTCMSIICDLLVVGIMERKEFTKEKYSKLHHGGYLGQKCKNV